MTVCFFLKKELCQNFSFSASKSFFKKNGRQLIKRIKIHKKRFQEEDFADNMLNLWSFNFLKEHHKKCITCQTYSQWVVEILKEQWKPIYGDFDYVINKIIKADKSFIDLSKISTS